MPLTYERDPKVPAAVGNQYPSVEAANVQGSVNPFPMKDSNTFASDSTAYPSSSQYSAPVTGTQYPSSGTYTDAPLESTSSSSYPAGGTTFGLAPGSTYGAGQVQGTTIIHDEHVRDRTIPGQGVDYDTMKLHEKGDHHRDHAFVAAPAATQATTVAPLVEGLAHDTNGRFDGFSDTPDGINSRTPGAHNKHEKHGKHGKHATEDAAAVAAAEGSDSTTSSKHADNDANAEGHKQGKIGQFFSNLTHKQHNTADKDPMQVYQDSLQQHSGSDTNAMSTTPGTSSSYATQNQQY